MSTLFSRVKIFYYIVLISLALFFTKPVLADLPLSCGNSIYNNGWFQVVTSVCDPDHPGMVYDTWACEDQYGNYTTINTPPTNDTAHVCTPASSISTSTNPGPAGVFQLQQIILRVINLIVEIAFIASLFMLLWGGIRYLTSGGEAKAVEQANLTVTWALVGILFLIIAFIVLKLIGAITGVDVTQFCIGFPGAATGCS